MNFTGPESVLVQSWHKWEEKVVKLGSFEAESRPIVKQLLQELDDINVASASLLG